MRKGLPGLVAASVAALAGCNSSSGDAKLNVRLVDAPGDYQEINLHVVRVEIHGTETGWQTVGTPDTTVNLLTLRDGVAETLVDGATIHAGTYTQMRLILGSGNSVRLEDGTLHDLKVPSGQQTGVKLNLVFTVEPNTTKDVFIDIDGAHSIMAHRAGASEKYILRPVVHAFDKLVTGAVLGRLTDAQTGSALPDVVVTAQSVDAGGVGSIVRTTRTSATGAYVLDLLPVGGSYHVVSQPVVGATAYAARSSGPIAVSEAAPTPSFDAAFSRAAETGRITGSIKPATEADGDTVFARQGLDAGGVTRSLVVRTATPAVSSGAESYAMELLPAGSYSLQVVRRTVDAEGDELVTRSAAASAVVQKDGTTVADLQL